MMKNIRWAETLTATRNSLDGARRDRRGRLVCEPIERLGDRVGRIRRGAHLVGVLSPGRGGRGAAGAGAPDALRADPPAGKARGGELETFHRRRARRKGRTRGGLVIHGREKRSLQFSAGNFY